MNLFAHCGKLQVCAFDHPRSELHYPLRGKNLLCNESADNHLRDTERSSALLHGSTAADLVVDSQESRLYGGHVARASPSKCYSCQCSKFGRRSLSLLVPPTGLHHVIADHAAPKSDLKALKKAGIEVTLV
jgi:hypothetical protein